MDTIEWLRGQQAVFDAAGSKDTRPGKAADEMEKLRRTILAALDCLHHDDVKGARRILEK